MYVQTCVCVCAHARTFDTTPVILLVTILFLVSLAAADLVRVSFVSEVFNACTSPISVHANISSHHFIESNSAHNVDK